MARASFSRALRWAFVMNAGQESVQSVLALLLAALLGPEAFGLMAMALVFMEFFRLFLGLGLQGALIQRKNLVNLDLDTAFWLVAGSTALLAAGSGFAANAWASFNRTPELGPIVLALVPMLVFQGLAVIPQAQLQKQMDFRALAIRSNVAVTLGGGTGLAMALSGFGVWSLVAQQLITSFTDAALLWWFSDYRPRLQFSRAVASDLSRFGNRVLLNKLGVFAHRRSDSLILGYFFGPVALALYRMAERLVQLVVTLSTRPVAQVSLPNFSQLQDDPGALRSGVLTALRTTAVLGIPALAGLAAVSDPLIRILGEEWQNSGPVLQILCVLGAARVLTLFTGALLQAVGRPGLLAGMTWALAVANVACFTLAGMALQDSTLLDQIRGIATTRAAVFALLYAPPFLYLMGRFGGVGLGAGLGAVAPSFTAAALVIATVFAVAGLGQDWPNLLALGSQIAAGGAVGLAALYALDSGFREQTHKVQEWLAGRLGGRAGAPLGDDS